MHFNKHNSILMMMLQVDHFLVHYVNAVANGMRVRFIARLQSRNVSVLYTHFCFQFNVIDYLEL